MKRIISAALATVVSFSMLAGCGKQTSTKVEYQEITFPLETTETINIWTANYASASVDNYSQMRMYKELMEKANVDITFTHPSLANVAEQFNIMIASNELPDIFEQGEDYYKGGLSAAYEDGVIIDIMEYIDYAPNLKAIMEKYPQLKGEICDENGRMLAFPIIRGGNNVRTYVGPAFRKDILDKYGLEIPETMDEWYEVLTTLKNNGIESPLTIRFDNLFDRTVFSGAYDIVPDYFVEDGKVVCGYYDERFKDYIGTIRKWYSEGLIDSDMMVLDGKAVNSKFLNGQTAAVIASNGGFTSMNPKSSGNPDFVMEAAPYPARDENHTPYLVYRDKIAFPVASITTQCKNKPLAVKLLDYFYSFEGNLLANFGIEGETYDMVDGKPVYNDYIMKNPDGKTMSQAGLQYSRAFSFGAFVQDKVYGNQWYGLDGQKRATELWTKNMDLYNEKNPFLYGTLTAAEVTKTASKQTDIDTYCRETVGKFILGTEPIENMDKFFAQLKAMGIEDIIKVKQDAYDRFIEKYPELTKGSSYEVSDFFWEKDN